MRAPLPRGTDGADANALTERVFATLEEALRLALGDDVGGDDLEVEELILHPADDAVLEGAVTLTAVYLDGVHARDHERPGPNDLEVEAWLWAAMLTPMTWRSRNSFIIRRAMSRWKVQ